MIFWWDIKHKKEKDKYFLNEPCRSCQERGYFRLVVQSRYVRLYSFLPLFPLKKYVVGFCDHCDKQIGYKDLSARLQNEAERLKAGVSVSLFHFTGLIVLLFLFLFILSIIFLAGKGEEKRINAPKVGDIYQFKTKKGGFSSLKVLEVKTDSLVLQFNGEIKSKKKEVWDTHHSFLGDTIIKSKQEVKKMYENDTIYTIFRPFSY